MYKYGGVINPVQSNIKNLKQGIRVGFGKNVGDQFPCL